MKGIKSTKTPKRIMTGTLHKLVNYFTSLIHKISTYYI